MGSWERARDWDVQRNIEELEENSYDLVGRDIWFVNGEKADLLLYRQENYQMEVYGFYENNTSGMSREAEDLVDSLRDIGRLLASEGFRYKVSTKRADNVQNDEGVETQGNYRFDEGANKEEIKIELEDLLGLPEGFDGLELLKCKK